MKFDYVSDTHLDFWIKELDSNKEKFKRFIDEFCVRFGFLQGDNVIIAGDIGHYFSQNSFFLKHLKTLYKNVFIVPGNHDRYLVTGNQEIRYNYQSENRIHEMKRFCGENDIHFLDGNVVNIDGVKISGLGMSWDDSFFKRLESKGDVLQLYKQTMNDAIKIQEGKTHIIDNLYGYKEIVGTFNPVEFFEREMNKLQNIPEVDVMVSHYGPVVPETIPEMYMNSTTTFFFFDGLKELKRINPKFWIFGHTHRSYNFVQNNTNLLCNPIGYPNEIPFTRVKTFEI